MEQIELGTLLITLCHFFLLGIMVSLMIPYFICWIWYNTITNVNTILEDTPEWVGRHWKILEPLFVNPEAVEIWGRMPLHYMPLSPWSLTVTTFTLYLLPDSIVKVSPTLFLEPEGYLDPQSSNDDTCPD